MFIFARGSSSDKPESRQMFKKKSARLAQTETTPVAGADSPRVVDGSDSTSTVSANDRAPVPGENTNIEAGGLPVANNEQSQNAVAVEKIFASTKLFEDRFGKLLPAFEQVKNLGDEAVTAFESIKT